METLGKIIFYLSNLALYHLLMWWGVNTLCVGVVAAGFEYWILFAVLIFLGIVLSAIYWRTILGIVAIGGCSSKMQVCSFWLYLLLI